MANGIASIPADKNFPSSAPGNQSENSNLKTPLFSQPMSRGEADAALNHITGRFVERQTSASQTAVIKKLGDDEPPPPKTVVDFYKKVLQEQPFDAESLSKKK